ncbi:hypothetical protein A6R68_06507 [Neotoma lepida]|uniref:Uncharacterized protein n=1 Tax=Neotoma lepida TaxID=56216 RepID=A0A1A6GGG3_NEOLE|nr:hypothetical protein A6R68_06507 [Neotoma lepida]
MSLHAAVTVREKVTRHDKIQCQSFIRNTPLCKRRANAILRNGTGKQTAHTYLLHPLKSLLQKFQLLLLVWVIFPVGFALFLLEQFYLIPHGCIWDIMVPLYNTYIPLPNTESPLAADMAVGRLDHRVEVVGTAAVHFSSLYPGIKDLSQAKVRRTNGKKLAPVFAVMKQDAKVVPNLLFEKRKEHMLSGVRERGEWW